MLLIGELLCLLNYFRRQLERLKKKAHKFHPSLFEKRDHIYIHIYVVLLIIVLFIKYVCIHILYHIFIY